MTRSDGTLWVFYHDSIHIYSNGDYNAADSKIKIPRSIYTISAIELDANKILLSTGERLVLYNDGEVSDFSTPIEPGDMIFPTFKDRNGDIWASSWRSGVFCYKNGAWINYNKDNSGITCDNFIGPAAIFVQDESGNIITGSDGNHDSTKQSGLFKFDGQNWSRINVSDYEYPDLQCIGRDSISAIWLGTRQGVYRYYENQWYHYGNDDANKNNAPEGYIRDVVVSPQNRVFIAPFHAGVYMLDQDEDFTCNNLIGFNITYPTSSSIWEAGTRQIIEWEAFGGKDSINLEYRIQDSVWKGLNNYSFGIAYPFRYIWLIPDGLNGRCQIRISDHHDTTIHAVSEYFTIVGEGQNLPPILQNILDSLEAKSEETTTWTAQATDPEGDPVTFTFSELPAWATVSQSTLTLDPTRNDSSATVRVIAADNNGGADTADLYIVVSHATTTEWGVGAAGPSANMLRVGKKKINIPAGKIKRVTLFNVQGKVIATVDTKNEHTNLLRITKNITDSFVVAKIQYGDKTSIQRTICLIE